MAPLHFHAHGHDRPILRELAADAEDRFWKGSGVVLGLVGL